VDEGFDVDGDGYTTCGGDCDDSDSGVNPDATEVCGDGVDNDCDGEADPPSLCSGKLVFVSSAIYDGNFGGGSEVLGHLDADQECQVLANAAGLTGTFKAWLSGRVDTGDGPLPHGVVDRFTPSAGPYYLVSGQKVADNWADLTDGTLDHAIDHDENGNPFAGIDRVWTNTTSSGTARSNSTNCALGPTPDNNPGIHTWSCGPTVGSPGDCAFQSGNYGFATSTSSSWTGSSSSNTACSNLYHLYCFEQ
jgi:hypothetical protein